MRKGIYRFVKVFLLVYALIGIVFYYFQDDILLHPEKLPRNYSFSFPQAFEEKFLALNKTDTIHLVRFLPRSAKVRGAVIYWHGNKRNIERYAPYAEFFTAQGYEVWMPDYPGFGKSTGEMNEGKLYKIADQVTKLVRSRFSYDSVIIYGKSFGTGIAAYTASYIPCKALILETPYYSIHSLFRRYLFLYPVASLSNYELPVWRFLNETRSPTVIIHGKKDGITVYSDAERLKKHMKANDIFVSIPSGSHNDLADYPQYKKLMDSVLLR